MHTAIPVCIILHMGIQDLISHMETISLCVRESPYVNVPAICKHTRVYARNHLENCYKLLNYCIWRSPYAYGRGTGVHAAKIGTKFANGDPCMHTGGERVYMQRKVVQNFANGDPHMRNEIVYGKIADTSQTDPGTHTRTPHMRTGRKAGNFAYGESPFT